MGRQSLKERINEGLFSSDGAMGTQLVARGTGPEHIVALAKELKKY